MKPYVDGFVIPIPQDKVEEYRRTAEIAGTVWREHGALEYHETVLDDPKADKMISFPQLADAKADETVIFAWIVYQSREHRDEVNAKVMADPRLAEMMDDSSMPFDCQRIAYGGFSSLVKL